MYHRYSVSMMGAALRKRRHTLGLTQSQLASQLGVTVTTVARWERGERRMSEPAARLVALLVKAVHTRQTKRRRT